MGGGCVGNQLSIRGVLHCAQGSRLADGPSTLHAHPTSPPPPALQLAEPPPRGGACRSGGLGGLAPAPAAACAILWIHALSSGPVRGGRTRTARRVRRVESVCASLRSAAGPGRGWRAVAGEVRGKRPEAWPHGPRARWKKMMRDMRSPAVTVCGGGGGGGSGCRERRGVRRRDAGGVAPSGAARLLVVRVRAHVRR